MRVSRGKEPAAAGFFLGRPPRPGAAAPRTGVGARACRGALAGALAAFALAAGAAPLGPDELAAICAPAEGPAHCGRLVEAVQMKRLPNLAKRDGAALIVALYPSGQAFFNDTETLHGGRTYSLWDYLDPINAVLLYATDDDAASFVLLQRATGRKVPLPAEPKVAPDRARLVTADFCPTRCVNELAVWRVTRDGVHKEAVWKPKEAWSDAGAAWRDAETIVVEYTVAGSGKSGTLARKLGEPGWQRLPP